MSKINIKLTSLIICLAIYWKLDATPSLYLAELYLRHINPSLLRNVFHSDTVTLITGASDGFGAEMAKQLCAKTSTSLILMARRKEKLEEVRKECLELSKRGVDSNNNDNNTVRIALVEGDVTKGTDAQSQWINDALDELGKKEVDIAVMNAGRAYGSLVKDTNEQLIRDIMELNYMGAVSTVKAVLSTYSTSTDSSRPKHMIAISSIAGKVPVALAAGYGASKAAMNAFFDSLRAENAHLGMRVTTVCPGPVQTNIRVNSQRENGSVTPKNVRENEEMKKQQMTVERAVRLTLAGTVVNPSWLFHELWFSPQPILTFTYIAQYIPDLAKFVGKPVGSCSGSELCEARKKIKHG